MIKAEFLTSGGNIIIVWTVLFNKHYGQNRGAI